jgi:hypothetical protein
MKLLKENSDVINGTRAREKKKLREKNFNRFCLHLRVFRILNAGCCVALGRDQF